MVKINVYDIEGNLVGEKEISEDIIKEPINKDVLYYYTVSYLANQRLGTHSTKTRGEVSGGGRKPWRQKGTGRARVGSIRNPIWRHGGIAFGPKPRDYYIRLPKKVRKKALTEAIRDKIIENRIIFVKIKDIEKPKTKIFYNFLKKIGYENEKILFVFENSKNKNKVLSVRNIPLAKYDYIDKINAYEILDSDRLILEEECFENLKNLLQGEKIVRSI
ncbi:MAG: 50S ribosomal protein L4 [Candidatus Omnitrophica bacterium]|nr:50S ribosomal protein L4 [Candidatus Omnitrophota bacterium]